MRLIDADVLIDEMKKWYWDKEKQRAAELDNSPMDLFTNLAIVTVKEQPTAYDIDKVVKELEKQADRYECEEQGREDVYMIDLSEAIEIVERGGKE